MRKLSCLAAAAIALATICPSQTLNCPLGQPLNSANQGNIGGGVYFNITVNTTVTWTQLTYVASDTTVAGNSSFNMFVGPSTWVGNVAANPGPWTLVASTTPVPIVPPVPAGDTIVVGVLNPAGLNPGTVTFAPGTYAIALQSVGHSWGYQSAAVTSSSPGTPPNFTVSAGGASNAFLATPTFAPRSVNGSIDYTLGGTPMPFAQREPYGPGCYAHYRSFYDLFPNPANFDLSNTSIYLTFDGGNNRWGAITAGTTAVVPSTSPSLGHALNSNLTVNLLPALNPQPIFFPDIPGVGIAASTVEMCSNLYVNLLGSVTPATAAVPSAWLSGAAARIGMHKGVDPTLGGSTHYDYDAVNQVHLFTWNALIDNVAMGVGTSTFQLAFFANGDCEFRFGVISIGGGGNLPTLVGYTPGNGSLDPGITDLSVRLGQLPPFDTSFRDQNPFTLSADVNPVLGATVNLLASNEPRISPGTTPVPGIGVTFIGVNDFAPFSPAGFDLGMIGAPGCVVNININPSASAVINNLLPGQMNVAFPIPPGPPSLIGQSFFCQSIWVDDTAQNQFFSATQGLVTSNAVRLKIGGF